MKKSTVILLIVLLVASLLTLGGYILLDHMRTDDMPPVITVGEEALVLSVQDSQAQLMQGVSAWDETDGDVTASLIIESIYGITEEQTATVTYVACDSAGNVAKQERQVRFQDYRSPRFTLNQALVFEYGTVYDVMAAVGAEDVFDGDILRLVKATMVSSGITVTEEGTHDVQFRVTNSIGDTAQLTLPVEIYPSRRYDAQLELTEYLLYLPVDSRIDPWDYLDSVQIQGETLSLREGLPDGAAVRIGGGVDTDVPGVYAVTYTLTYDRDGHTYSGYSKLLVVVEG